MGRLPKRFAPVLYGLIQAAITTGLATFIATYRAGPAGLQFLPVWGSAWGLAWLMMLPVVIFISPVIQSLVAAMTDRR